MSLFKSWVCNCCAVVTTPGERMPCGWVRIIGADCDWHLCESCWTPLLTKMVDEESIVGVDPTRSTRSLSVADDRREWLR
jgi:hypothetical protein